MLYPHIAQDDNYRQQLQAFLRGLTEANFKFAQWKDAVTAPAGGEHATYPNTRHAFIMHAACGHTPMQAHRPIPGSEQQQVTMLLALCHKSYRAGSPPLRPAQSNHVFFGDGNHSMLVVMQLQTATCRCRQAIWQGSSNLLHCLVIMKLYIYHNRSSSLMANNLSFMIII